MKRLNPETEKLMHEIHDIIKARDIRGMGTLVKYLRITAGMEEHLKLTYKNRAHFTAYLNSRRYTSNFRPRIINE